MASPIASLPMASPQPSPSNSIQRPDTSLATLLSYLVASKRSLASIHLVQRATSILSEARSAVESTSVLIARTKYLRRSLASQVKILRGVQFELEGSAQSIQIEVKAALKELDAADKNLEASIQLLKEIRVEDGFKASRPYPNNGEETPAGKETLHDFVDDIPVEDLRNSLKTAIDTVEEAKHESDRSIHALEEDLQAINHALTDDTVSSSSTGLDLQKPGLKGLLKSLEDHAREMARGLESLVKHFDLCVTAIKHTEGGGAAVAKNVDAEDLPDGVSVEDFEPPAQPMTEEERMEMLQVLEGDAAEVDDVVIELQDRSAEMEAQLELVMLWREKSEGSYNDVDLAFKLLEKVGGRLSSHIAESSRYCSKWAEEKAKIEDWIAGMNELREVYENFLNAYDRLIIEAARRKTIKRQMEKIVMEAHFKLEQLYEDDLAERDAFRREQGGFLPGDIWQGLTSLPAKFVISRIDVEEGSVPDLPRKTVEEAWRRLKVGQTALRYELLKI